MTIHWSIYKIRFCLFPVTILTLCSTGTIIPTLSTSVNIFFMHFFIVIPKNVFFFVQPVYFLPLAHKTCLFCRNWLLFSAVGRIRPDKRTLVLRKDSGYENFSFS